MTKNTESNTPERISAQIEYLSEFMLPERAAVLRETLARRTRYMTVCMENTFHPQNASALVRTCEAFGVQDIYTVEDAVPVLAQHQYRARNGQMGRYP